MVPSFTTSGYSFSPLSSPRSDAAPRRTSPLPSQCARPLPTCPSMRLSSRFSRRPLSSHVHLDGSGEIFPRWVPGPARARLVHLATLLVATPPPPPARGNPLQRARSPPSCGAILGSSESGCVRNVGSRKFLTTFAWVLTTSYFASSSTLNLPSMPMAIFVGSASGIAESGLRVRVQRWWRYSAAPVRRWSSARWFSPTPWWVVRLTWRRRGEGGVDALHAVVLG